MWAIFTGQILAEITPLNSIFNFLPITCDTLTDPTLSCHGSLLKTTPPPPGYLWVPRGRHVTLEPRFRGLVLDHQLLKEPEAKSHSKRAKFDQKQQFLGVLLALAPLNLDGRAPNP